MKKARILLVDDHQAVRKAVAALIATRPEWEICGEASSGTDAVAVAAKLNPDLIVMDFSMPNMNGLEATREILKDNPAVEVLVLSMHKDNELVAAALASGARGFVLKDDANSVLVSAVEALLAHKVFISPGVEENGPGA